MMDGPLAEHEPWMLSDGQPAIAHRLQFHEDDEVMENETKPMPKVVPTKKPVECDHPEWEKVGSMFKQCTKCGERAKR